MDLPSDWLCCEGGGGNGDLWSCKALNKELQILEVEVAEHQVLIDGAAGGSGDYCKKRAVAKNAPGYLGDE